MVLEMCDLQAVISMPGGIFYPYSGVATAVLVFVKGGKTDKVWFYDMQSDGYTLDQRRVFIDGKGDIPDIIKKFREGRQESERSMLVDAKVIKNENYVLASNRYGQGTSQIGDYPEPKELLSEILEREKSVLKELEELRSLL
jgi:type I restriction enzyme M protein